MAAPTINVGAFALLGIRDSGLVKKADRTYLQRFL